MSDSFKTIILRFRDLVTTKGGTVDQHNGIISNYGYVWWAWWKKGSEKLPAGNFSLLNTMAQSNPVTIFLVDSGQGLLYQAICNEVRMNMNGGILSPEAEKTPEYYRGQEYWAWFRFTKITLCDASLLKQYSYVDCQELFNEINIDYSKFNDKIVYSISELIQQNRTVWFIRQAKDTDNSNEIVLLNSEYIQPTVFSQRYYQAYGDTLLWLSDLHLADNRFDVTDPSKISLSSHITNQIKKCEIAGVLVSGDITSCAKAVGFEKAKLLFQDLSSQLGQRITADNTLICPGNHDFIREDTELEDGEHPAYIWDKLENSKDFTEFYKSIYKINPNKYFAMGRKILLSSGYELEIAALNSLTLQQYKNFEGHGFLSKEQLDYVSDKMGWSSTNNQKAIRIVMMHHHYLPTCYTEEIDVTHASSAVYDANSLMTWLIDNNVKILLHGHKHRAFVAQVSQPQSPRKFNINFQSMKQVLVIGMGGTGSLGGQNMFSTLRFNNDNIEVRFYDICSDGSEQDNLIQEISLPLV